MSGTSGKTILVLSDGKPGHVNQSIALARHLDCPFETVRVDFRNRPFKLLSYLLDRVGVYLPSLLRWDPSPEGPFRAVVSAGSETYYGNKLLARRLDVPSVAIMFPRGYRLDFDLIIAQDHDRPPVKENILALPVNLCRVEPTGVFRPREGERYVGLVVGGPNRVSGFDRDRFREALDAVFSGFPGLPDRGHHVPPHSGRNRAGDRAVPLRRAVSLFPRPRQPHTGFSLRVRVCDDHRRLHLDDQRSRHLRPGQDRDPLPGERGESPGNTAA